MKVALASESDSGTVEFDHCGDPRWKWITETDAPTDPAAETFNHMKALDNCELSIDAPPEQPQIAGPPRKVGYNPYDVAPPPLTPIRKR